MINIFFKATVSQLRQTLLQLDPPPSYQLVGGDGPAVSRPPPPHPHSRTWVGRRTTIRKLASIQGWATEPFKSHLTMIYTWGKSPPGGTNVKNLLARMTLTQEPSRSYERGPSGASVIVKENSSIGVGFGISSARSVSILAVATLKSPKNMYNSKKPKPFFIKCCPVHLYTQFESIAALY